MKRFTELQPIKETPEDFHQIETRIMAAFRRLLFAPLLKELGFSVRETIANAKKLALERAIELGRVTYDGKTFRGQFSAAITKELKALGAVWAGGVFKAPDLPYDTRAMVSAAEARFQARLDRIRVELGKDLPEKIAGAIRVDDLLNSSLWRLDRNVRKSAKGLAIVPELSADEVARISSEWGENLGLWIKDFTAEEIKRLRKDVEQSAFQGNRHESLIGSIRRSFGVTETKAKFLARQETSLLLTKVKEARYTSAGITKYRWGCVAGSPKHPVRPAHKALEGRIFSWNDPPITTPPGEPARRNNPGQDFNCRCFAKPIVDFRAKDG